MAGFFKLKKGYFIGYVVDIQVIPIIEIYSGSLLWNQSSKKRVDSEIFEVKKNIKF